MSIKSFPDYEHLLQGNYVEYKHIFLQLLKLVFKKLLELSYILKIYRVSIKSFPDYKHLLQGNYVEYKHIFLRLLKLVFKKLLELKLHFENIQGEHKVFP